MCTYSNENTKSRNTTTFQTTTITALLQLNISSKPTHVNDEHRKAFGANPLPPVTKAGIWANVIYIFHIFLICLSKIRSRSDILENCKLSSRSIYSSSIPQARWWTHYAFERRIPKSCERILEKRWFGGRIASFHFGDSDTPVEYDLTQFYLLSVITRCNDEQKINNTYVHFVHQKKSYFHPICRTT